MVLILGSTIYNEEGNVIKETYNNFDNSDSIKYNYEYDKKYSPYYRTDFKWANFLGWLSYYDNHPGYFLSKNNILKQTRTIPKPVKLTNYNYIYNGDGYPIQISHGLSVINIEYVVKE